MKNEEESSFEENHALVRTPNSNVLVDPKLTNLSFVQALKEVVTLTVPYTAASFILMVGNFVGVVFIGKLGPQALAASNLTSSIQNCFTTTAGTTLTAGSILAGRKIGADDSAEVGAILHKSWLFSLLLSMPCVAFMVASKPILLLLGQEPEVVALAQEYFYGYSWGLPAMFLLSCNRKIALATKNANVALCFIVLYQGLDTLLSYGLIFGEFYLPELGIAGLGYSNSITAWATFLLFSLYMCVAKRFKPYHLGHFSCKNFYSDLWQFAKIGLPLGAKVAVELFGGITASFMIGSMGSKQQAAQEATQQYIAVLSTPLFGIMDTVSTLVSRAVGTGNYRNAKKLGYTGIGLGVSIATLGLGLFLAIPNLLLGAFIDNSDSEIMSIGRNLLWINGLGQIADSVRNIAAGGLSGFLDIMIPTIIIIVFLLFIYIPLSFVMGFPLNLSAVGVMSARDITIGLGAILLFSRWAMVDKKTATPAKSNEAKIEEIRNEDDTDSDVESAAVPVIGSNNAELPDKQDPLVRKQNKTSYDWWPFHFKPHASAQLNRQPVLASYSTMPATKGM